MNIEKMREEFEAWAKTGDNALVDEDMRFMYSRNTYYFATTRYMWEAWQASRESLVIDLPESWETYCGTTEEHVMYADEVKDAIKAAGLKVNP